MLATSWPIFRLVADASSGPVDMWGLVTWCAVLIGLLLVAASVLTWARRKLTAKPPAAPVAGDEGSWTLDGLRQLKAAGLVSDEEYQRLRTKLIDSLKGTIGGAGSKGSPPASPDNNGPAAPESADGSSAKPGSDCSDPSGSNEGQAG